MKVKEKDFDEDEKAEEEGKRKNEWGRSRRRAHHLPVEDLRSDANDGIVFGMETSFALQQFPRPLEPRLLVGRVRHVVPVDEGFVIRQQHGETV